MERLFFLKWRLILWTLGVGGQLCMCFSSSRYLKKSTVFCIWIKVESWLLWSTHLSQFDISGKGTCCPSILYRGLVPHSWDQAKSGWQTITVLVVNCHGLLDYSLYLCFIISRGGGRKRKGACFCPLERNYTWFWNVRTPLSPISTSSTSLFQYSHG